MNNIAFISYLRALSTVAVIIIHATGIFAKAGADDWVAIINHSMMWAVPVFLMISGYLLLGEAMDTKTFYAKRLSRFIIPFVFWNLFYFLLYQLVSDQYTWLGRACLFLQNFYSAPHLWYLVLYLQLIIVIPIINSCFTNRRFEQMRLLLVVIAISFVQLFLVKQCGLHWLNIFNPFLLIVLLGYVFKIYEVKISPFIAFFIVLILLVTGYIVNGWTSISAFDYLSPLNISITIFLFIAFKNIEIKNTNTWVDLVSKNSLGIYLIHFILIEIAHKLIGLNSSNWAIAVIAVLILSLIAVIVLSKIPYLKRIV